MVLDFDIETERQIKLRALRQAKNRYVDIHKASNGGARTGTLEMLNMAKFIVRSLVNTLTNEPFFMTEEDIVKALRELKSTKELANEIRI